MKEPNEVKSMQDAIRKVYQTKKNKMIKENYKNIDVLPTVYDTPDKEGFKGLFKKMGKGLKKGFKPVKKWNAPYTGPPLEGPLKDIDHNPANNISNIILKGESLLKFFTDNETYLASAYGSSTKRKTRKTTVKDLLKPFAKCPCIRFPKNRSPKELWECLLSLPFFFTDYIPCLIDGYCDLIVTIFTTKKEYVIKQDKELVKSSVHEFLYIFVAGYLAMMFFYYTVMDTSNFVNPQEFFIRIDNHAYQFFVEERFFEYLTLPIHTFNMFFTDVLPYISTLLGLLPFAKLNYIFLFMVSIAMVFNGIVEKFFDMFKKSFRLKADMMIYVMILFAIVKKLFDINYSINDFNLIRVSPITVAIASLVCMVMAILFAPVSQMMLVIYVIKLFLFRPLFHFFEELDFVKDYLSDPDNDVSCDTRTGEFFGELSRIVTKFIYPIMLPLVFTIFFGYRLYLSGSLHSSALRTIMYIINMVGMVLMIGYMVFAANADSKLSRDVNIETRSSKGTTPDATDGATTETTPDATTGTNPSAIPNATSDAATDASGLANSFKLGIEEKLGTIIDVVATPKMSTSDSSAIAKGIESKLP